MANGSVKYYRTVGLSSSADGPAPRGATQSLLLIKQSGEKAAAIVQDMLTLSRQGMEVKRVVTLGRIVGDYLHSPEYRQLQSNHPGVRLEVDLQEGLAKNRIERVGSMCYEVRRDLRKMRRCGVRSAGEGDRSSPAQDFHLHGSFSSDDDGAMHEQKVQPLRN